jgi:hypothetical protein
MSCGCAAAAAAATAAAATAAAAAAAAVTIIHSVTVMFIVIRAVTTEGSGWGSCFDFEGV